MLAGLEPQLVLAAQKELGTYSSVFAAIAKARAQAVLLLPDSTFYIRREQLAELALRYRLPMSGNRAEFARAGALTAYGSVLSPEWRRAGVLVGRILNGAKPADIPIEQPTRFELVVNLKTAKALRLTVPPALLLRADQVSGPRTPPGWTRRSRSTSPTPTRRRQ